MISSDCDNEIPKKKKKELRNMEKHKHKEKQVPERRTREACTCVQKCFDSLTEDDIDGVAKQIKSYETRKEQDIYLQSMIELFTPKDLSKRSDKVVNTKHKSVSCKYFIETNTGKKKVCKSAFVSLYGIKIRRCRRLIELKKEDRLPRALKIKVKKSVVTNKKAVPGEYAVEIQNFIESFDNKEIHYSMILKDKV